MVNMGSDRSPERAREDYIKAIYQLSEGRSVRSVQLARHLGVTRASVSKFKRMLEREHLLEPSSSRTGALVLTKKGRELAVRMVRRHRLVETFLHTTLRVPLERVHFEAERIEHAISDDVSGRLARFLHNPVADPHGHRIPGASAHPRGEERVLVSFEPTQKIVVTSVGDRDENIVRRLSSLGVLPGLSGEIVGKDASGVHLRCKKRLITLPLDAAADVRCRLLSRRKAA
jgi:DtxR family transcriptional regulator, Mn-dependent transcriptional regulator